MEKDRGTNFVLVAVRENADLPLRTAPLVALDTVTKQHGFLEDRLAAWA